MKINKTAAIEARLAKIGTRILCSSSIPEKFQTVKAKNSEKTCVKFINQYSDEADALIVELSNNLTGSLLPCTVVAKYPDEASFVFYQRYQLVSQYLKEVNVGEHIDFPEEASDFFRFAMIEFPAYIV